MKFSDITAVVVVIAVDVDELFTACDRKTPNFNIAFAASNSNAKSNPETKFLLAIFKFLLDDGSFSDDEDNDGNNDLRFLFNRQIIVCIKVTAMTPIAIISINEVII